MCQFIESLRQAWFLERQKLKEKARKYRDLLKDAKKNHGKVQGLDIAKLILDEHQIDD